jgi:sec-independent protein translocase protein TatB
MLDIGWSELLVVAIVAIVVVGPKDLPKLMRTVGFYVGKARRAAADFQRQFNEAIAESEADEVRKNLEAIRANMGPAPDLSQPIGKPLMTGPSAASETDFVTPPETTAAEPALPEPPAEKKPAKKTPAKKKAPAKKKPRPAKEAAAEDGEPKP